MDDGASTQEQKTHTNNGHVSLTMLGIRDSGYASIGDCTLGAARPSKELIKEPIKELMKASSAPGSPDCRSAPSRALKRRWSSSGDLPSLPPLSPPSTPKKAALVRLGTPEKNRILYPALPAVSRAPRARRLQPSATDFVAVFKTVPHLAEQILGLLSDRELATASQVSYRWRRFIYRRSGPLRRRLRRYRLARQQDLSQQHSDKENRSEAADPTPSPMTTLCKRFWGLGANLAEQQHQHLAKCVLCGCAALVKAGRGLCHSCGAAWCSQCRQPAEACQCEASPKRVLGVNNAANTAAIRRKIEFGAPAASSHCASTSSDDDEAAAVGPDLKRSKWRLKRL